jgi:hypothetical protein
MKKIALHLILVSLFPALAFANDGVAGVSAGGIVFHKTDAIAMKREVLNVSYKLISVDYEFLNESAQDVEETLVFPLPAYPVTGRPYDSYYGQPSGFSIRVDGQPVSFTPRLVALLDKKDVTATLKKIGLTEAQIAYNPQFAYAMAPAMAKKIAPLTEAQEQQLTKAKLFGEGFDGEDGPLWEAQVNYVWKQRFPANQVVRVHHEYHPFTDKGPGASYMDPAFAKTYCADKDFYAAYNKIVKQRGNAMIGVEKVSYILKTGNTWKRGIEDFTLNVIKGGPGELISLCFPGTFAKSNATTYQVRLRNFQPADDLRVYFGNIESSGSADNDGVMPALSTSTSGK